MRIVDRYVSVQWIKPVLSALIIFLLLFLLIDVFGLVERLIEHQPALSTIIGYLSYRTGYAIFFLSPMALLIGGFWMTFSLRARNEWSITQLTGTSPIRVLRAPLLLLGVFTAVMIGVNCFVMPYVTSKVEHLDNYTLKNKTKSSPIYRNIHVNLPDGRIVKIGRLKPDNGLIRDITISNPRETKINLRIDSPRGTYRPEAGWMLEDVSLREITNSGEVTTSRQQRKTIPLAPPSVLETVLKLDPRRNNVKPVQYTMRDLLTSINYRKRRGMNTTTERILFHWKFGFPLANFVMGLIGLVVGLRMDFTRAGGIGFCLLLGLSYWILFSLSISWGKIATPLFEDLRLLPYLFVYGPPSVGLLTTYLIGTVFTEQA